MMSGSITKARQEEHRKRVQENENRLEEILRGDFEEIEDRKDFNLLRNYIRKEFHIDAKEAIPDEILYGGWLCLKRKYITSLDKIEIYPRFIGVTGVFASKHNIQPIIVSRYNGLNCDRCGHFTINSGISLPLMSIFVNTPPYKVTVMTPEGDFCDITENQADMEVITKG